MARITAGIACSHVPAIGAAIDLGKTQRAVLGAAVRGLRVLASAGWRRTRPTSCSWSTTITRPAFSLDIIPTFAIGCADEFAPADEGWGPRPVPVVQGHPELAAPHRAVVIQSDFDLTIVNRMDVDHGLTVPLSLMFGQPQAWPCRVIPFAVNVVQYPPPSGNRCYQLGKAIRRAIESFDAGPQRADLGHRRHESPAAGAARRAHQPGVRHAVPRQHRRPIRSRSRASRTSSTCARQAPRASSW